MTQQTIVVRGYTREKVLAAIAEFEREYPNVSVRFEGERAFPVPSPADLHLVVEVGKKLFEEIAWKLAIDALISKLRKGGAKSVERGKEGKP